MDGGLTVFLTGSGDNTGRLHTVHLRHPNVHHHHVRFQLLGQVHGGGTVSSVADDLNVWLGRQERDESVTDHLLIVSHDDPDSHWPSTGSSACTR